MIIKKILSGMFFGLIDFGIGVAKDIFSSIFNEGTYQACGKYINYFLSGAYAADKEFRKKYPDVYTDGKLDLEKLEALRNILQEEVERRESE